LPGFDIFQIAEVSILVFLDQALKVYAGRTSGVDRPVSILVFLDQALKDPASGPRRFLLWVSILVFLDQALKAAGATSINVILFSFNPCFPGSSAERGWKN